MPGAVPAGVFRAALGAAVRPGFGAVFFPAVFFGTACFEPAAAGAAFLGAALRGTPAGALRAAPLPAPVEREPDD